MSRIIDFCLFIILLYLEVSLFASDYWWVGNIQLLTLAGTVKLTRGNQFSGVIFVLLGTLIIDLFMFRNLGLIAIFFVISLLITRFISSSLKFIGLPGSSTYSIVIFLLFLTINNFYLYLVNVLDIMQIIFVTISSTFILVGLLLVTSVKHKSRNAFKI